MTPRVLVTGMGVVSSIGLGRGAFWQSLVEGRSGTSTISSFDATRLGRTLAAEVQGFVVSDHLTAVETRRAGRCAAFALAAARMAVRDAGLSDSALRSERASVVLGTTMGEADICGMLDARWILEGPDAMSPRVLPKAAPYLVSMETAQGLGCRGTVLTLPAACAAGNYAIGYAADLIRAGRADVVITGAAEMLQELQFAGFVRLGAVAPERCQPFDLDRQGLIVGEGAGVMVLESEEHAVRRGATALAEVGGYGLACDGFHITRPEPSGAGVIHALREAIRRSGLTADEVDFINAHGTGTKANDAVESTAVRAVFGDRRVPISSIKSIIGHCMGAASAIEAVSCVETINSGIYPPTLGYSTVDPECDVAVVANTAGRGRSDVVVNHSLAFGGYDAVVLFAKPDRLPSPEARGDLS
ncbi:MAG: beta-ketoacyl-[acyl-carrier-protein] synthase family protein [Deltaproteobacteria bacterium]|nr:beta-ketoacyl-[acyl-carrier-protein] synthase family protein [Deltaproteobacteria bacterium]